MSQNPYAQPAGYDVPPEAARTSVMAVLSLVCSLICIVPGLALLGIILAIASLSSIGSSRGRLGGKGLAISGLVIGIIVLALQCAAYVGWKKLNSQFGSAFVGPVSAVMTSIEQKDYQKARTQMNSPGAAAITDAQFDTFRDAYQGKLGTYQSMPDSFMKWVQAIVAAGPLMKSQGGTQPGLIPMPATFAKGTGIVWVLIDQRGKPPVPGQWVPPVLNIGILDAPNSEVWLIPRIPTGVTPAPAPNVPPAGTPPSPGVPPTNPPPAPPGGNGG
jgi:hypothetical protein